MRCLFTLAVMSGLLMAASPAAASCAAPQGGIEEQLKGAEAVFVGTVVAAPEDARLVEVSVEEVWRGEVDEVAWVRGSPVAGNLDAATSTDRAYSTGRAVSLRGRRAGVVVPGFDLLTDPHLDGRLGPSSARRHRGIRRTGEHQRRHFGSSCRPPG
jgi:hypothetical protein